MSFVWEKSREADGIHLHTDYSAAIVRRFANYCKAQSCAFQKALCSWDKKSDLFLSDRLVGSYNRRGQKRGNRRAYITLKTQGKHGLKSKAKRLQVE